MERIHLRDKGQAVACLTCIPVIPVPTKVWGPLLRDKPSVGIPVLRGVMNGYIPEESPLQFNLRDPPPAPATLGQPRMP